MQINKSKILRHKDTKEEYRKNEINWYKMNLKTEIE